MHRPELANYPTSTNCTCSLPVEVRDPVTTLAVRNSIHAAVDLDKNGLVDHRDVRLFETQHGLPHALSNRIRAAGR